MHYLTLFSKSPKPLNVSQIALGCDHFGEQVPSDAVTSIIDAYFEMGGNFFDTAHIYSQSQTGGVSESEKLVGAWIAHTKTRNEIVLSTKGAHPERSAMHTTRITEKNIHDDLALSLETLGVDSVDIWFLHRDNPDMPAGEIVDMVSGLVDKGYVKHLGASNWTAERLAQANDYATSHGKNKIGISQVQWSLARSTPESWQDSTIVVMDSPEEEKYTKTQMPVMIFSPQAHGLFSKVIKNGADSVSDKFAKRFLLRQNMDRIERCRNVSVRTGVNPAAISLAYLMSASFPAIPIIGASSADQIRDSLQFADLRLDEEERRYLADG